VGIFFSHHHTLNLPLNNNRKMSLEFKAGSPDDSKILPLNSDDDMWDTLIYGSESEREVVEYSDQFEGLPAQAFPDYAHIINLESYKVNVSYDLELPDAVATILYKISKETLELFLSARTNTFRII
jgi:hypothetical protein